MVRRSERDRDNHTGDSAGNPEDELTRPLRASEILGEDEPTRPLSREDMRTLGRADLRAPGGGAAGGKELEDENEDESDLENDDLDEDEELGENGDLDEEAMAELEDDLDEDDDEDDEEDDEEEA